MKHKAYVFSVRNGVVQIGSTVYCVYTNKRFSGDKPSSKKALGIYEVPENSFRAAEEALYMHRLWMTGKLPMSTNLKKY